MIKKLLRYVFIKLSKVFDKEINKANKFIDNTQERFAQFIEDSYESEAKIDAVIKDAREQIEELNKIISKAVSDKKNISDMQEKLKEVNK